MNTQSTRSIARNSKSFPQHPEQATYSNARQARDARFDGVFFIGVKSTGIYCRPICPANPPLEKNIEYYDSAVLAAQAGFRPCLRCRPDSAPMSCAWMGTDTTFQRSIELIHAGALQQGSLTQLADRLGISDRYLRELFQKKLGTSPKKYALYQQCLFAKQLLHESNLAITEVAFAAGFSSVRRFNEVVKEQLGLAPREIRKKQTLAAAGIKLKMHYRPPYVWQNLLGFLQTRVIEGLEWGGDSHYSRTIQYAQTSGYFTITAIPEHHRFDLEIHLDDYRHLNPITQRIRALFDVDAPIERIDQQLSDQLAGAIEYLPGLRLPGIWNCFEAGIRAILGQQISVGAAKKLVTQFVHELGAPVSFANPVNTDKKENALYLFPEPEAVIGHELDFFKMPQARKDTVRRLAEHFVTAETPNDVDAWINIKGIGPWTINYVKMRANKDPDIWLAGDAGLRNALKTLENPPEINEMRPWRSYLTMQLWNQL